MFKRDKAELRLRKSPEAGWPSVLQRFRVFLVVSKIQTFVLSDSARNALFIMFLLGVSR